MKNTTRKGGNDFFFSNFVSVKKGFIIICLLVCGLSARAYNDHRGHNLDSLEREVAKWTPDAIEKASEEELVKLNAAYRELMLGYSNIISPKCEFYARKALSISQTRGWEYENLDALRHIGQCFWASEELDSAAYYYNQALEAAERLVADPKTVDDARSVLYGTVGNLYNTMGNIPEAMRLYAKAGEIFDKYGWNSSNAVLYYNIGETWTDEGDLNKALDAYQKSLSYAQAANDSLWMANAQKGLGRLYMEKGQNWKAVRYFHKAEDYFSLHDTEEPLQRKENFEYMSLALESQQRLLTGLLIGAVLLVVLVLLAAFLGNRLRASRQAQADTAAVMEETLEELRGQASAPSLSKRELEILDLLSKGYTTPQIAEALCLSPETVKWYRKKLLVKFDVANTAELVAAAQKEGRL